MSAATAGIVDLLTRVVAALALVAIGCVAMSGGAGHAAKFDRSLPFETDPSGKAQRRRRFRLLLAFCLPGLILAGCGLYAFSRLVVR